VIEAKMTSMNTLSISLGIIGGIIGSFVVSQGSVFTSIFVLLVATTIAYFQAFAPPASKREIVVIPPTPAADNAAPSSPQQTAINGLERGKSPATERLETASSPKPLALEDMKESRERPESQTICVQVVSPGDCAVDHTGRMFVYGGMIMSWMDIAAAICATKHARKSCVTVAIDSVQFLHPAWVNNTVSLKATVVRASNTSMEIGVMVQTQDRTCKGPKNLCCFAFLTFVALDANMEKTNVPKLTAGSERMERIAAAVLDARTSLTNQKKQFADDVKDPEKWKQLWEAHPAEYSREFTKVVPISSTMVHMTQVVQPQHTNTVGITFGGWILRWLELAGAVCADRHSGQNCISVGMDEMIFKKKTKVGWILHFKAQINRVFGTSMELYVTVSGQSRDEPEETLIAGAYLTYTASGDTPIEVGVFPENEAQEKEYYLAFKRRALRLEALQKAKLLQNDLLF
jgi:acyl-CoA hydrolase